MFDRRAFNSRWIEVLQEGDGQQYTFLLDVLNELEADDENSMYVLSRLFHTALGDGDHMRVKNALERVAQSEADGSDELLLTLLKHVVEVEGLAGFAKKLLIDARDRGKISSAWMNESAALLLLSSLVTGSSEAEISQWSSEVAAAVTFIPSLSMTMARVSRRLSRDSEVAGELIGCLEVSWGWIRAQREFNDNLLDGEDALASLIRSRDEL